MPETVSGAYARNYVRSHDWSIAGPSQSQRRATSRLWAAAGLGLYLGLALGLFAAILPDLQTRAVGASVDPGVISWYLAWWPFALSHGLNPFLTTYIDYPTGVNLLWNTSLPLPAVLLWPATAQFGSIVSYNIAAVLAPAVSAWCAYLAFRRYVKSPLAPIVGGLLYGFSPFILAHAMGHQHLSLAFVPPLMLLVLDEILIRQSRPWLPMAAALAGLGLAQLLIGEELLASEAFAACLGLALLVALYGMPARERIVYAVRALGAAAGLFLVVAAPLLVLQFFGPQHVQGVLQPRNLYVSDLLNFFMPTNLQAIAPAAVTGLVGRFTGNPGEWGAYLGIPLIGLLIYVARRGWQEPAVRVFSLLALFLAVLSMGSLVHVGGRPTIVPVAFVGVLLTAIIATGARRRPTYIFLAAWGALALVPGLSNLLPARLTVYVFLFLGLLVAWFCDLVLTRWGGRRLVAGLAALAIALIPLIPRLPFPTTDIRVPVFFRTDAVQLLRNGGVALVAPYAGSTSTDAMVWQAASGFRFQMPEGYAWRPGPTSSPERTMLGFAMTSIAAGRSPQVTEAEKQQMLAELAHWRVSTVIVGPMPFRAEMIAFFSLLLGTAPTPVADVLVWTP